MKAVILAGGKGTRGRPFTDYTPKAMIPINGKPLIEYIIRYLEKNGTSEIIIIADYTGLGGQIKNYFKDLKRPKITFVQDSQSGTGGDLIHISKRLDSEFLLWFVDNLCKIDIKKMQKQFKDKKSLACIATRSKRREETGFALVKDGIIEQFKEKPTINMQLSECLGIYILSDKLVKKIKNKKEVNLSYDILQELAKTGKASAFDIGDNLWMDIESPVLVDRNQKYIDKIIKQMGL